MSGLDSWRPKVLKDCAGLHTLEGVREISIQERPWETATILLVQIDGRMYAFFEKEVPSYWNTVGISCLDDMTPRGIWAPDNYPFNHASVRRIASEIKSASAAPVVCNFIWRQGADPRGGHEALFAIDEVRNLSVLKIGFEQIPQRASSKGFLERDRTVLSLSSNMNILPGETARITLRPQSHTVRPHRLLIGGNPEDWIVEDLIIGSRSQFAQAGGVPGAMFAPTAFDLYINFETLQMGMNLAVDVTYVGNNPLGSPFSAGLIGSIPVDARRFITRWTPEGLWEPWMVEDAAETTETALANFQIRES